METVKKGTGRPAAAAKRRTHAQRTPLPPRRGQVKAAQEPVQEPSKTTASTRGTPKATKPRAATRAGGKGTPPETKSAGKAVAVAAKIESLGWAVATEHHGETSEVTATREGEVIWVSWVDGKLINRSGAPMATYALGARTVVIRNASEALKLAARDSGDAVAAQPQARTPMRPKAERSEAPVRLPFDPATDPDEMVVNALLAAQVQWRNSISEDVETAWMPATTHEIGMQEGKDGDRTVKFMCRSGRYRAFRLSALVRVSGNTYRPRKRTAGKRK